MNRAGLKKVLAVGVAIFGFGLCAMPASAGWGWHGGCCGGWYGGYSGCGCGCYSCGYGGYGCGCYSGGCGWGGCYSGGCGWGGCYGGGCGWGGCYSGGCDSSCCGTSVAYTGCGCSTCGGGQYITQTAASPPSLAATSPSNRTSIESSGEGALLTVSVPNDAKVTINGVLTKSTGSQRRYLSYGLRPGTTYEYKVKAEVVRAGKVVTDEQTVPLTAGAQRSIAFGFQQPGIEGLATTR